LKPTTSAPPRAESNIISAPIFLTAEWRDLVMANYEATPDLLQPLVPNGTELDLWNGKTFVSLVGFRFLNTQVWNLALPFHRDFEEVNLRFYVRRKHGDAWRRGVVFIKEIVPRMAIAWAAKTFYNENYVALPMAHRIETTPDGNRHVSYSWNSAANECRLAVTAQDKPQRLAPGSEAEFILEHYWGYSRQRDGSTLEYQVEHPAWHTQPVLDCVVQGDFEKTYGSAFDKILRGQPASVFLAGGSPVTVRKGVRLA
jgi:uncharacterized protein YqjF (DUF2071 family)